MRNDKDFVIKSTNIVCFNISKAPDSLSASFPAITTFSNSSCGEHTIGLDNSIDEAHARVDLVNDCFSSSFAINRGCQSILSIICQFYGMFLILSLEQSENRAKQFLVELV